MQTFTFLAVPSGGLEIVEITLEAQELVRNFEHVHLERVDLEHHAKRDHATFDMVRIATGRRSCDSTILIGFKFLVPLQEWLASIGFDHTTTSLNNLRWENLLPVCQDERFECSTDTHGDAKPTGWNFLRPVTDDGPSPDDQPGHARL